MVAALAVVVSCLILLVTFLVYPSWTPSGGASWTSERRTGSGSIIFSSSLRTRSRLSPMHSAIINNLLWIVVFTAITVGFGLLLAVLAARVRYESLAKSAIFIPMAISFVAASVIWKFMYEFSPDIGTVNAVAAEFGRSRPPGPPTPTPRGAGRASARSPMWDLSR